MPFVIKTNPISAKLGGVTPFAARPSQKHGGNKIQAGDEVFIWFGDTKKGNDGALSFRGVIQRVSSQDEKIVADVRLDQAPALSFRTSDLKKVPRGTKDGTPNASLAENLCYNRHQKIVELTEDEAKLLRSYFRLPNIDQRKSGTQSELEKRPTPNPLSRIEADFEKAERSEINPRTRKLIDHDLSVSAIEGMTAERWGKVRLRASWLADTFIRQRHKAGTLNCDDCEFDPGDRGDLQGIGPRSLLDVHHKAPLEEGVRNTTTADFALLCPTCHRITHARLRLNAAKP